MICSAILLALLGLTLAKTNKCFKCEFRPPSGGFEPCIGPITAESAKADGVDDWGCHSACYTSKDAYGNIVRGCYEGEFGVNPNGSINGQTYWFCQGDHCNGDSVK